MTVKEYAAELAIDEKDIFTMVLGESDYLPGGTWAEYLVTFEEDGMACYSQKEGKAYKVRYEDFTFAEFGIGSGNLWLQCIVEGKTLVFCSPRKSWKTAGKILVEKLGKYIALQDVDEYKKYTGKLFFLYMFK